MKKFFIADKINRNPGKHLIAPNLSLYLFPRPDSNQVGRCRHAWPVAVAT
jgi:hypothetical protein